jgi:hypothetical protein
MSPDLEQRFEQLAQLISGVSESLHREMHDGFDRITSRLDLMETRLNRHGALHQTGARWSARMTAWCEDTDKLLSDRDQRIGDLEQRVQELERKRNGQS